MMSQTDVWMGGGVLMWALLGVLVVLAVVIKKITRKK